MLDEKSIKIVESNVKSYLEEGLLKKNDFQEIIFRVLINNANDSLETANFLYKNNKSNLWVIVSAYYSMFYIANAVLYKIGYKVGEKIVHKVTSDALIVFVRNKLKESLFQEYEEARNEALEIAGLEADELLKNFDFEMVKRSKFQYKIK